MAAINITLLTKLFLFLLVTTFQQTGADDDPNMKDIENTYKFYKDVWEKCKIFPPFWTYVSDGPLTTCGKVQEPRVQTACNITYLLTNYVCLDKNREQYQAKLKDFKSLLEKTLEHPPTEPVCKRMKETGQNVLNISDCDSVCKALPSAVCELNLITVNLLVAQPSNPKSDTNDPQPPDEETKTTKQPEEDKKEPDGTNSETPLKKHITASESVSGDKSDDKGLSVSEQNKNSSGDGPTDTGTTGNPTGTGKGDGSSVKGTESSPSGTGKGDGSSATGTESSPSGTGKGDGSSGTGTESSPSGTRTGSTSAGTLVGTTSASTSKPEPNKDKPASGQTTTRTTTTVVTQKKETIIETSTVKDQKQPVETTKADDKENEKKPEETTIPTTVKAEEKKKEDKVTVTDESKEETKEKEEDDKKEPDSAFTFDTDTKSGRTGGGTSFETRQKSGDIGSDTPSSGSFMAYFLTAVVLCIAGYVVFHNKQKIIAFIIEGRSTRQRRRTNGGGEYKKLQSNVEEVMPSLDKSTSARNFIY